MLMATFNDTFSSIKVVPKMIRFENLKSELISIARFYRTSFPLLVSNDITKHIRMNALPVRRDFAHSNVRHGSSPVDNVYLDLPYSVSATVKFGYAGGIKLNSPNLYPRSELGNQCLAGNFGLFLNSFQRIDADSHPSDTNDDKQNTANIGNPIEYVAFSIPLNRDVCGDEFADRYGAFFVFGFFTVGIVLDCFAVTIL